MPPYLASPHFHLSRLPVTTKWALTFFDLSLLAALVFVGVAVFAERTGYTRQGVEVNVVGTDHLQEKGVVVDQEVAAKTKRQLYDIVHPHSFLMPVIFFILCHLMEMAYAPKGLKIALYVGSGASMILVTFAPLLIRASLGFAVLLVPATVILLVSFTVMIVAPAVQMWFPRGRSVPGSATIPS
jgi:hypothetical protein